MDDVPRRQEDLERLEAEFRALRAMWNSPLMVAQQQVRLLARAGYRLIPGPEMVSSRGAWIIPFAVSAGVAGLVVIFVAGLLIGWDLPGSPP
jgi:hypothetical protein